MHFEKSRPNASGYSFAEATATHYAYNHPACWPYKTPWCDNLSLGASAVTTWHDIPSSVINGLHNMEIYCLTKAIWIHDCPSLLPPKSKICSTDFLSHKYTFEQNENEETLNSQNKYPLSFTATPTYKWQIKASKSQTIILP